MNIISGFFEFKTSLHKQEAIKTTDNNYTRIYIILIMMNDIRMIHVNGICDKKNDEYR